jgi:hypothetical protein
VRGKAISADPIAANIAPAAMIIAAVARKDASLASSSAADALSTFMICREDLGGSLTSK